MPTYPPAEYEGMQHAKPFHWKPDNGKQSTAEERQVAVAHICAMLETGLYTLRQIIWYMDPRIADQTIKNWRKADPEIAEKVDAAFEVGMDNMDERRYLVAVNAKGHKHPVERAKLVCNVLEKQLAIRSSRHRQKTVISNDPDAPFLPAQFVVQPVQPAPQSDDDEPAVTNDSED